MATLIFREKAILERYLEMGEGYVLDFSDYTFSQFVSEATHISIDLPKYRNTGNSKAKRLRVFWEIENDYVVGKLIRSLIEYRRAKKLISPNYYKGSEDLESECEKIAERLKSGGISPHIEAIAPITDESDFNLLCKSIRESIERNEPETALDRLHTFYVRYIRELCRQNGIEFSNSETLNALFGKYLRFVEQEGGLESDMTQAILKYSISLLEKFNYVRNNRSLAHDNKLLNYHESLYVFDALARLKTFIDFTQEKIIQKGEQVKQEMTIQHWGSDLPF